MLLREAWPTMVATMWGFLLSAAFGIPVAMMIAGSRTIESYVYPLLVFSQSIPKIAIAPLFVVWFGFGMLPKVLCAFLLGFFPVVVSAVQGFKSVEPDMMDLARSMEANRWQIFRMVSLPHAMPSIFAGLKVSITLAVVGAVVGEFVGSNYGIGFVLAALDRQFRIADDVCGARRAGADRRHSVLGSRRDRTAGYSVACQPASRHHHGGLNKEAAKNRRKCNETSDAGALRHADRRAGLTRPTR